MERNVVYRRMGYKVEKNMQFILSHALPLSGKILEIGTGKGRFLTGLLSYVPRVTTIDVNPEEQRYARLNVAYAKPQGRARFMITDAADMPWSDHFFDGIISVNALHHMKNIPRVIDEILRVVKPGGKIVLADFNKRGFAIMNKVHRQEKRIHERLAYRFRDIVRWFTANGWTAVLRSGDCQDVLIAVNKSSNSR